MKNPILTRSLKSLIELSGLKKLKDAFLQQSRAHGSWVLGLDQGTAALRYILWDKKSGVLIQSGRCELERQDSGGTKARLDMSGALREISRGIPKNKLCAVHLNIQGGALQLGFLEMAAGAKSIQPSVFRHAVSSQLPFPVEDAGLVYREVLLAPAAEAEEGSSRKVIVNYAACHKPVIAKMVRGVQSVFGLIPDVTTQGYAQEALLRFSGLGKAGELNAVINGGRSITSISIIKDGQLLFEREIPLAGQDITRSIFIMHLQGQTLRSAEDLKTAEQLKCQSRIPIGQTSEMAVPESSEEENKKLYQAMQGVLSAWIQDIRLSFAYFNEHYELTQIQTIFLTGGMANHKNLTAYLSRELGLEVQVLGWPATHKAALSKLQNPEVFQNGFHEYATAFGLAVKPSLQSSLTPREYHSADWAQVWEALLRVFIFTSTVFFIGALFFLQVQENRLKSVKLAVDTHRQFLNKLEGPYEEMLQWESLLKRSAFLAPAAADFFQVLTRLTPADLVLTAVSYNRESGDIQIDGAIYGDPRKRGVVMVEFSNVFKRDPRFKNVEVPLWESNAADEGNGRFRLSAQYKTGSGAGL